MNVTVEDISATKKRLKIEVPADRVQAATAETTAAFQQQARLPGFRPGKAPVAMIKKKYGKDIEEETKRTLVPESFREAVASKNLTIVTQPEMEEINFEPGLSMSFAAVVEVEPAFALPEYKGLEVPTADTTVAEEDVQKALDEIREQRSEYLDITPPRPSEMEDFAIIAYEGKVDGQPIAELLPKSAHLGANKNFPLWLKPDGFLPGFADQLVGLNLGDKKTVEVDFPGDFPQQEMAGKHAVYEVELKELKQRKLPELDDAFCQEVAKMDKESLVTTVRENLEDRKQQQAEGQQKEAIVRQLLGKLGHLELPETLVKDETNQNVYNIVSENQARGVPREMLEEKKGEIYENAEKSARDQVKLNLLARRIAEEEKIDVSNEELGRQVQMMALQQQTPVDKFVKQLQENNAMPALRERVLLQKVLDFLLQEAKKK
ncbi:MAG: trigger factor [Verrucomicrobiota bacterium]